MNRRTVAFTLLAVVTALMWSDTVIEWWQSILEFFLRVNESVTESVLETRPGNDMDLHVLVWASTGAVFVWAFRNKWWPALLAVFAWSALVETLQPVFTETRSRQVADYAGNAIGVAITAVSIALINRVRRKGQLSSPAR